MKGHIYRVLALEVFVDDLWYAVVVGLRKDVCQSTTMERCGPQGTDLEGSGEHLPVSGIISLQHLADRVDVCLSRVRHGCRLVSAAHPWSGTEVSQGVCRKDVVGGLGSFTDFGSACHWKLGASIGTWVVSEGDTVSRSRRGAERKNLVVAPTTPRGLAEAA